VIPGKADASRGPPDFVNCRGPSFSPTGDLESSVSRFLSFETTQDEIATYALTTRASATPETIPLTHSGNLATLALIEHVHEGARVPQGVAVLNIDTSPRALRQALAAFGAIMAERMRYAPALAQLQAAVQPAPRASDWH
jgi:hypothetical protein